jgi:hypothetical protein
MVPNAMMQRTKTDITIDTFLDEMKRVQDGYNAEGDASPAGAAPLLVCFAKRRTDLCGLLFAVQALDGTMFCW